MASLIKDSQTDRRRKFIIDVVYIVILVAVFILFLKFAFYPLLPIEIAVLVALLLHKPVEKIAKKTKIPKGITATIIVILVIALLIVGFYALGVRIVRELMSYVHYVQVKIQDYSWVEHITYTVIGALPKFLQNEVMPTVENVLRQLKPAMENDLATGANKISFAAIDFSALFGNESVTGTITDSLSSIGSGVIATAKQIPAFLVGFVICIVLCCFMTIEYEQIESFIKTHLPGGENNILSETKKVLGQSVGKLAKAYFLICCITFSEMLISLSIFRLIGIFDSNYIFAISLLTALFDILPVLGLGMVIIPWIIYCVIVSDFKMAIGLLIMYIIMFVIRHIIEPKLVSGAMSLPSALTLSVMYIGLKMFGAVGMFAFVIALYCIVALEKEGVIQIFPKIEEDAPKIPEETPEIPAEEPAVQQE